MNMMLCLQVISYYDDDPENCPVFLLGWNEGRGAHPMLNVFQCKAKETLEDLDLPCRV